jgi:hypothetical protein
VLKSREQRGLLTAAMEPLHGSRRLAAMARYYFDIESGTSHRDEVGETLKDDRAAWREAMRRACEIEDVLAPGGSWRMTVRKEKNTVFRVSVDTDWPMEGEKDDSRVCGAKTEGQTGGQPD